MNTTRPMLACAPQIESSPEVRHEAVMATAAELTSCARGRGKDWGALVTG